MRQAHHPGRLFFRAHPRVRPFGERQVLPHPAPPRPVRTQGHPGLGLRPRRGVRIPHEISGRERHAHPHPGERQGQPPLPAGRCREGGVARGDQEALQGILLLQGRLHKPTRQDHPQPLLQKGFPRGLKELPHHRGTTPHARETRIQAGHAPRGLPGESPQQVLRPERLPGAGRQMQVGLRHKGTRTLPSDIQDGRAKRRHEELLHQPQAPQAGEGARIRGMGRAQDSGCHRGSPSALQQETRREVRPGRAHALRELAHLPETRHRHDLLRPGAFPAAPRPFGQHQQLLRPPPGKRQVHIPDGVGHEPHQGAGRIPPGPAQEALRLPVLRLPGPGHGQDPGTPVQGGGEGGGPAEEGPRSLAARIRSVRRTGRGRTRSA